MFSAAENVTFGVLSILAGCISTFSFFVHLRAGNTGVILMMFWCFIGLVNKGINALAFNHSLRLAWTFGCDVSAVIDRSWQLGLTLSSLCVLQRLEQIASLRQAHSTISDRKRRLAIDLMLGLGIPFIQIPLFFIVQPYRLIVAENIGCSAPLYSSVPALFVFHLWRLLASILCAIFAVLILRWFVLRQRQFTAALSSQHSGLSQRKYFRLFALAVCEAALVSVGQFYLIIDSLRLSGLQRYSWAQVHQDFDTIAFVPMPLDGHSRSALLPASILRWLSLTPAVTLFLFFGLTEDAKSIYIATWRALKNLSPTWSTKRKRSSDNDAVLVNESLDLEAIQRPDAKISVLVHKERVLQ
ncbi:Pheromone receptor a2 [Sporisorium reilianum SRZ2]|uniref:Pheromone receptor a2 n=2 Tax=Sporisorium reilianum TaxID=72558 RepID=E6ZV68_SPORE|nr:peromone receptor a2 [Sporisorium reilianum]CBQ71125.1 Pheromone receptor a2 [Sporisorium reilianum SRZ2]